MRSGAGIAVSNDDMHDHAERLLTRPVALRDLAVRLPESRAASVEVLVEGRAFYPPMIADIRAATSSVHINQFGFRPGRVGEEFADALVAKLEDGIPVRLVVDKQGSDPEGGSRAFYERLTRAGAEICVVRATKPRAAHGRLGAVNAEVRWNLRALGHIDHRKVVVVDGRVGWVGGAGIEDHFSDGRFHDLFLRVTGPVVAQLQLVFLGGFRWLGGEVPVSALDELFPPAEDEAPIPATVLHNAPGEFRPITRAIARMLDDARGTLDVVNPYVTDRGMIRRIEGAARRGVGVRLFVPANANNWACAAAQQHHHAALLDAGVRILEYPTMLHAKAFVRDEEEVLAGTCNLEAWSLKRFFEIDLLVESAALAAQLDERFSAPAEAVSSPGRALTGVKERARGAAFALISPFL
jgi:cardiolipin synthase